MVCDGILTRFRNWPIGLSYDLLTGLDPSKGMEDHEFVPWTLLLHKKAYPKEHILSIIDTTTVLDYWMNQIKEVSAVLSFLLLTQALY